MAFRTIEYLNAPPTVSTCPKLELRLLAKTLLEATRQRKLHTKEKENETLRRGTEGVYSEA